MRAKKNTSTGKGELARMGELRAKFGYKPDDEGFTADEYAERYHLTPRAARTEVERMVGEAYMIKGAARRLDKNGQTRRVNVYRMK